MFIRTSSETRPNYLVEAMAVTIIVVCIGVTMFSNALGIATLDSKPADGFGGFKMVNTSHHHQHDQASN